MNNKGIKLRYALLAVLVTAVVSSYATGYYSEPPAKEERQKTYAENCADAVVEDMRAHTAMRRALRQAEEEARSEDMLAPVDPQ